MPNVCIYSGLDFSRFVADRGRSWCKRDIFDYYRFYLQNHVARQTTNTILSRIILVNLSNYKQQDRKADIKPLRMFLDINLEEILSYFVEGLNLKSFSSISVKYKLQIQLYSLLIVKKGYSNMKRFVFSFLLLDFISISSLYF